MEKSCNMLEELDRYFRETPKEKIMEDWAKFEKYDQVGPTIDNFRNRHDKIFSRSGLDLVELEKKFDQVLYSFTDDDIDQWIKDDERSLGC